jgi:hypothetical protein
MLYNFVRKHAFLVGAVFSGGGSAIFLIHGFALTFGVIAGLFILSMDNIQAPPFRFWLFCLFPLGAALWSLTAVPVVLMQARIIAGDGAFCIAERTNEGNQEIRNLWGLRGLSFYTTLSGYKTTSSWYFHGILRVKAAEGKIQSYNWSPGYMTFQRIENPHLLMVNPSNACRP